MINASKIEIIVHRFEHDDEYEYRKIVENGQIIIIVSREDMVFDSFVLSIEDKIRVDDMELYHPTINGLKEYCKQLDSIMIRKYSLISKW